MQNVLLKQLPKAFTSQFPQGVQIAYSIIPTIPHLDDTLKADVRAAFAHATQLVWQVMLGCAGAGLLSVLLMREEKLRTARDQQWDLRDKGILDEKEATEGDVTEMSVIREVETVNHI